MRGTELGTNAPSLFSSEESFSSAQPFLKWAGGKTQLLGRLAGLLPPKFNRYAEPFVGSGALFFSLRRTNGRFPAFLSDYNPELVNCYLTVRDRLDELIPLLRSHQEEHSKKRYYEVRRLKPNDLDSVQRAARLIYLNKTCFNGLYRVNSDGEFNVPMGSYVRPRIFDEEALRAASAALQRSQIYQSDFAEVEDHVGEGDFIYFDPPYHPISRTSSFTGYAVSSATSGGRHKDRKASFGIEEQQRLAATFAKLDRKRCFLMLSNSESLLMRQLYRGYKVQRVEARRTINCDGTKRGVIHEIVVSNY